MISAIKTKEYGKRFGFDIVRITTAEPFPNYAKEIKERAKTGLIPIESLEVERIFGSAEHYSDPQNSLSEAKTIISLGMRYLINEKTDYDKPKVPRGRIGRHLWRDFYGDMWKRKAKLAEFLERKGIHCSKKEYLPQKQVAQRAGAGTYGKNCVIQNETYGSWIILCSIVTDANLEVDSPSSKNCGSCTACVKACPTHAIVEPHKLNIGKCINYLLASSHPIPAELRPLIGNRIDSCDRCQEVCPSNQNVTPIKRRFTNPGKNWGISPALIPFLSISDEEFQKSFHNLEFYTPERRFLQRNAIVALGNIGDPTAVAALKSMLKEQEPILRAHASWAIGKIGAKNSKQLLLDALHKEKETGVKQEMENALQTLK